MATLAIRGSRRIARCKYFRRHTSSQRTAAWAASTSKKRNSVLPGLLICPDKSLPFVARYIDSEESATGEAATLALGESRLPAAFEILKQKWARTIGKSERKVLLVSMAASRLEEAIAFLLAVVGTENVMAAVDALEALAIYRLNERVSNAVHDAVSRRGEKRLLESFTREFASPA